MDLDVAYVVLAVAALPLWAVSLVPAHRRKTASYVAYAEAILFTGLLVLTRNQFQSWLMLSMGAVFGVAIAIRYAALAYWKRREALSGADDPRGASK